MINCAVTNSQCEGVYVYSAALYTRLDCSRENSCAEMGVYAGNTGIYPDKLNNEIFFERNHYNSFYMDCTGKSSCLKSSVYIKGTFIDGGKIDADSNGLDGFKESSLVVSIHGMNIFDLVCGLSDKNCYSNTKYECQSGMCYCNTILHGNINGCSHLYTGGVIINSYVILSIFHIELYFLETNMLFISQLNHQLIIQFHQVLHQQLTHQLY